MRLSWQEREGRRAAVCDGVGMFSGCRCSAEWSLPTGLHQKWSFGCFYLFFFWNSHISLFICCMQETHDLCCSEYYGVNPHLVAMSINRKKWRLATQAFPHCWDPVITAVSVWESGESLIFQGIIPRLPIPHTHEFT